MAATNPIRGSDPGEEHPRPTLVSSDAPTRSRRGLWIGLGIAVLVVAAIVGYFVLYGGGGSSGGSGGGGGTGGYFVLMVPLAHARRLWKRARSEH